VQSCPSRHKSANVGHITFNRPQACNTLIFAMYQRLAEGDTSALIITGAGDKAFAAGTGINQFRAF
jgi:enoyl-CoA hydratase